MVTNFSNQEQPRYSIEDNKCYYYSTFNVYNKLYIYIYELTLKEETPKEDVT